MSEKRLPGRPSKYDPAMCEIVVDLMSQGYAKVEVAVALGISRDTLDAWSKDPEKPEFSDAVRAGEMASEAWWMTQGRIALRETGFNQGLWFMNMKNRHGWRDKPEDTSASKPVVIYLDAKDAKAV